MFILIAMYRQQIVNLLSFQLNVKVSLPSSRASSTKSSTQVLTGRQAKMKKEKKGDAGKTDIPQLNKQRMKDFKKMKKQRKRDGE